MSFKCIECGNNSLFTHKKKLVYCGLCESLINIEIDISLEKNFVDSIKNNEIIENDNARLGIDDTCPIRVEQDLDSLTKTNIISPFIISSGYSIIWQTINNYIKACPLLYCLESNERKKLVDEITDILHHCSFIWNNKHTPCIDDRELGIQNLNTFNIQLPKDCILRICASVFYVIRKYESLMNRINTKSLMAYFYKLSKNSRALDMFQHAVYNFISLIQEFRLGGKEYALIKQKIKDLSIDGNIVKDKPIEELNLETYTSNCVQVYQNILSVFFFRFAEYEHAKDIILNLYNKVMYHVLLDGKGPKMTMAICVYVVIMDMYKNVPGESQKKRRISKKNSILIVKDEENSKTILLSRLIEYFLDDFSKNKSNLECKKRAFQRCLNKFQKNKHILS